MEVDFSQSNRVKNLQKNADIPQEGIDDEDFTNLLKEAEINSQQKFLKIGKFTYQVSTGFSDANKKNADDEPSKSKGAKDDAAIDELKSDIPLIIPQLTVLTLIPIDPKAFAVHPSQAVQSMLEAAVIQIEKKGNDTGYLFKIQDQKLEIRFERRGGELTISIFSDENVKQDLTQNRQMLIDLLKTRLENEPFQLQFEDYIQNESQGQGNKNQQEPEKNHDEESEDSEAK